MARSYSSAAKRAAQTPVPAGDLAELLAWVDGHTTRARQVLRELDARPSDPRDTAAATARQQLVDALLDVFPSFDLDGERFRVLGEMQLLDLCELMRLNKRNVKTVDPAGIAALADFFAGCLGPDEYERFRQFCRDNCVDQDVLNDVMEGIVEDLAEVPTSRPSHSVGGPSTAGLGSRVDLPATGSSPMSTEAFRDYLNRNRTADTPPYGPPTMPDPTPDPGFVYFG